MEPFAEIFRISTNIVRACADYLVIKEVRELKEDINLIKGSFFADAIDFVDKISMCQNENNIRYFLESAYGKFCQSVRIYQNANDKLVSTASTDGMVGAVADSFKTEKKDIFAAKYNETVDYVKAKAQSSPNTYQDLEKDIQILKMSYVGKAMCEYYMGEYGLCVRTLDEAIGAILEPTRKIISQGKSMMALAGGLLGLNDNSHNPLQGFHNELLIDCIRGNALKYFDAINAIFKEKEINTSDLLIREQVIDFLAHEVDKVSYKYSTGTKLYLLLRISGKISE